MKLYAPQTTELKPRIVVFGVGGAGGNAVNNMIDKQLEGCEFVVANTDAQALTRARTPNRIQPGHSITEGLGAGARPEVGQAAAQESQPEIIEFLDGAHMVFVAAGMGGGTGTGAAPVIARTARERGILTIAVVTKPFHFEGQRRMQLAETGVQELRKHVDTLIVIPNQNLFRVANERTTFAEAFQLADQVLYSGVRGVTDLMVMPGLINLDFADVRAVMSEMGKAMMGTGEASGEDRALQAAQNAIANPLLDETSLKGAKAVLVNITGGMDMTLLEVDEAANAIAGEVDADANIIFGAAFDPALDGKIRVSVVATGMEDLAAVKTTPNATTSVFDTRRPTPAHAASRAEPVRHDAARDLGREPVRAEAPRQAEAAPIVPTFQASQPTYGTAARAPEPRFEPRPEPVIHVAEERSLEPIVDPWVEEYESAPRSRTVAAADAPVAQGDLYMDRTAASQTETRHEEPAHEDYDDRDHRKSGWSLFGRGKRQPAQPTYPSASRTTEMRATSQTQPAPELGEAEDDLEIPSFLRRLAN
ncbi:cell division protein FtsZ [Brevundimonas sp. UBA2416]|uniref:cell division protein FtsZ n=1 Tax=Brevundimonas sp. UBA2416 TaxID=1946124 RepID=UPI0025C610FA|nr:cell division protein FtsZ [Brevundimonas sp. UBA2416]